MWKSYYRQPFFPPSHLYPLFPSTLFFYLVINILLPGYNVIEIWDTLIGHFHYLYGGERNREGGMVFCMPAASSTGFLCKCISYFLLEFLFRQS